MAEGWAFLEGTKPVGTVLACGVAFTTKEAYHPKQGLDAEQVGIAHRKLSKNTESVLQIGPAFLVFFLRH